MLTGENGMFALLSQKDDMAEITPEI